MLYRTNIELKSNGRNTLKKAACFYSPCTEARRHLTRCMSSTSNLISFLLTQGSWLKQNMGTSVQMIERHYGQTKVLVGIEFETARRKKQKRRPDLAPPTMAMMSAPEPVITSDDDD